MAQPRRRLTAEVVALTAAVLAAGAAVCAPITAELTKADPPPQLTQSCLQLQQSYVEAVQKSPADRERILPGIDGRSTLLSDPQAQYCGITPEDFK
jgi:hypothetical protein